MAFRKELNANSHIVEIRTNDIEMDAKRISKDETYVNLKPKDFDTDDENANISEEFCVTSLTELDALPNNSDVKKDKNDNISVPINILNQDDTDYSVKFSVRDIREISAQERDGIKEKKSCSSFLTNVLPKSCQVSAEKLAASSRAAAKDKWIVYNSEEGDADLPTWINNYKPSTIKGSNGIGWIAAMIDQSLQEKKNSNQDELKATWAGLAAKKGEINMMTVRKLAKQFGVTGGKWLLHVNTDRVDMTWEIIVTALYAGTLGKNVIQAKVSPLDDMAGGEDRGSKSHVICVYNTDFMQMDQVLQVEASLRQAKLRCMLQYKPEIFSILGIYRNNRWGLRPTIYHSQYQMKKGKSIIESVFENTWFWNETKGMGEDHNESQHQEIVSNKKGSDVKETESELERKVDDSKKDSQIKESENDVTSLFRSIEKEIEEFGINKSSIEKIKRPTWLNKLEIVKNVSGGDDLVNPVGVESLKESKDSMSEDNVQSNSIENSGIKLMMGLGIDMAILKDENNAEINDVVLDEDSMGNIAMQATNKIEDESITELTKKVRDWLVVEGEEDELCVLPKKQDVPMMKENDNKSMVDKVTEKEGFQKKPFWLKNLQKKLSKGD